ncbi:NAD(P)H-binding protein [Mucilaginibacter ginsenosidivorax]|uniref:NAD-dependent dehydratase n=1 Tax=Mucilaginibacter ginsenosidivorax TaxID=862126 RepID=A0A5B8VZ59_9SPHI|nr:NAD(P)H-binding protein [Mucilaginibacter ginsenosidivorax]QEC76764.1 NAD-dependent dehydratase [Mucilaginibacter ginsenosidivorax]
MKIVVTGSLGNIGKPLTQILVGQGHHVTVVSSNPKKQQDIETLGAKAAIGSIADIEFLARTFTGANAVYGMIPLSFTEPDLGSYLRRMAQNYTQALQRAQVKRVVVMSGWAADLVQAENVEDVFDVLTGVSITVMRPASFYTNFYQSMDLIRGKGLMGKLLTLRYSGLWALLSGKTGLLMGNYGGDDRTVFVSPLDIADAVAEELLLHPEKKTTRYVGSEEMACNEAAQIIGKAIGKPWLKWVLLTDKQMLQGMKMAGLPEKLAETLVEMQAAMHSGKTLQNFHRSQPRMGKVKLADFAKEFAVVYHKK